MSAVEVFQFPETGQRVRTVMVEDEPWFVAADVCTALEIANPSDAVRNLDDDEYRLVPATLVTSEGRPNHFVNLITEPGLYSLIMRSRKAEAKAFKRWVTREVLPSIRKTGQYAARVVRELDDLEVAERYVAALKAKRALEARNAELEPKAAQADHFREADGLFAVAQFANDLALYARENHGVKLLHEQVRDFLGEIGMVIRSRSIRRNEPTAAALKSGLMRAKHDTIERSTGPQAKVSARLTPKGWSHAWDKALAWLAAHGSLDKPKAIERRSA